jgi:hypothetical protein
VRERVKELTPRRRGHEDIRAVIADVHPVLRGWGNYFRTANAEKRFNQVDTYVWQRLWGLRMKRKGRRLKPGEAAKWTREHFWKLGLHRLRGTVRYPQRSVLPFRDRVMLQPERPPVSRVREIRTHGLKGGLDSGRCPAAAKE